MIAPSEKESIVVYHAVLYLARFNVSRLTHTANVILIMGRGPREDDEDVGPRGNEDGTASGGKAGGTFGPQGSPSQIDTCIWNGAGPWGVLQ